jgi:hypothetical protein
MTPEQLEEIPGIGEPLVEKIQLAVNNYYGQFETGENAQPAGGAEIGAGSEAGLETAPEADAVQVETELPLEEVNPEKPTAQGEAAEGQPTAQASAETLETEPNIGPPAEESGTIEDSRQGEEGRRPEEPSDEVKEG